MKKTKEILQLKYTVCKVQKKYNTIMKCTARV